jgi:hypothetical protein
MERSLKVKRIYAVGQYQNIEFTDEIVGIPENLALKEEVIDQISLLQLLRLEIQINKYSQLREKYANATPEKLIALLESDKKDLVQSLAETIKEK